MSKRPGFTIQLVVIIFSFFTMLVSCHKEFPSSRLLENLPTNHLDFGNFPDKQVKINQALIVYDETRIRDSIDYEIPPTDRYYEWTAIPGNGCVTIAGDKHLPKVDVVFHCAGVYQLTATIYNDSLQHIPVGKTDTLKIQVTTDTLYPKQPILQNEVLTLRPDILKSWSYPHTIATDPPDEVYIQFIYSTSNVYDYGQHVQLDYSASQGAGNYTFAFSDSVRLNSYPFAFGYGLKDIIQGSMDLHGLVPGVPARLSIVWLGKTYNGTITLVNKPQYQIQVSMNTDGVIRIY